MKILRREGFSHCALDGILYLDSQPYRIMNKHSESLIICHPHKLSLSILWLLSTNRTVRFCRKWIVRFVLLGKAAEVVDWSSFSEEVASGGPTLPFFPPFYFLLVFPVRHNQPAFSDHGKQPASRPCTDEHAPWPWHNGIYAGWPGFAAFSPQSLHSCRR